MIGCATCGTLPPLCGPCEAAAFDQLAGVAAARGTWWAQRVAKVLETDDPWPDYDASERIRARARRLVEDLARDERLLERLARWCSDQAGRAWSTKP